MAWPRTEAELAREQDRLAADSRAVAPWGERESAPLVGACAVVFGRGGRDDLAWAAAVVERCQRPVAFTTGEGRIEAPFRSGQLALREGPVLEAAVRALSPRPDVLIVAAAGRDHPRRAGLALHLGAVLDLPTVGVTDEPLLARGEPPGAAWASRAPLHLDGEVVAYALRSRRGANPVVAHAGWRTSAELAAKIVLLSTQLARFPEPLREARRLARELRARAGA